MAYIADHLFPPIQADDWCGYDEYSNFNFWRDPVPEIQMEAVTPKEGSPNSRKQKQQQQQTNDMAVTGRSSTGGNNNSQLTTIPEK